MTVKQSSLLIADSPLQTLPSLAVAIGLNEAIFLQQLHYLLLNRAAHKKDGVKFFYNSIEDWHREEFPFWSPATIKRIVRRLRLKGLLIVTKESATSRERVNWYSINYSALESLDLDIGSNCTNASGHTAPVHEVTSTPSIGPGCTNDSKTKTSSKTSSKNSKTMGVVDPPLFAETWEIYPNRNGNNPRIDARKAWQARLNEGVDPQAMRAGTIRYKAWCNCTGKIGTELVMRASTFYGPALPFEQGFNVPADLTKPNVDKGCIFLDDAGARCPKDGQVAVLRLAENGVESVYCVCGEHHYPAINIEGTVKAAPQTVKIVERFKQARQEVMA